VKKVSANTNKLLEDTPKQTAQGYVVFESPSSIPQALLLDNTLLSNHPNGFRLRVDHAAPTIDSSRSVFVGNLKYAADETTLRKHFNDRCGWDGKVEDDRDVVVAVRLVRDKETMQCKGFGYVLLKDKSYVPQALKVMHDSVYMNQSIRVIVCKRRFKGKKGVNEAEAEESTNAAGNRGGGHNGGNRGGGHSWDNRGGKKTRPRWKQQDKDKQAASKATEALQTGVVNNSALSAGVKRKKRGAKKNTGPVKAAAGHANGISKRAATSKKREKRINKLQKRMTKGMGKMKKT